MPSFLAIFSSKKTHREVKEEPSTAQQGELKLGNSQNGFAKVTQLQKGEDYFKGDSAYEAQIRRGQELAEIRMQKSVRLIAAKFEEIILEEAPNFLSTPESAQTAELKEKAESAMVRAREFAEQQLLEEKSATVIQREVRRFQAHKEAKKELDRLKKRAENRKLLVNTMSHVQGLIKAGVLDQNEHTGKVKVGTNPDARYQEEFEEFDPADTFDNPLAFEDDLMARDYQARYPLKERVAHADRLMNHKPKRKTLDQMIQESKAKKAEREEAPKRKRMTKEERVQALISGNSFFSEMREPLEISMRGERYTIHPKPSVVLKDEFDAAFAELDAKA